MSASARPGDLSKKGLKKIQRELHVSDATADRARKAVFSGAPDEEVAQRRLDEFYERCDAIVIPADTASSREVLDPYFKHQPPFEAMGDKKLEFPDAYALVSLEQWAQAQGCKVLVVSKDEGWKAFCEESEYLEHRAESQSHPLARHRPRAPHAARDTAGRRSYRGIR